MEELSLKIKVALRQSRLKGVLRVAHQRYRRARVGMYRLQHPSARIPTQPLHDPETVVELLEALGMPVRRVRVDSDEFAAYLRATGVPEEVYAGIYRNKMLEHFLSIQEISPTADSLIVDIACHGSPFADTVRAMYGCTTYRQDLLFLEGIHGDRIGGDASNLPLASGTVSGMTLHNSLEHFEGHSDTRFIMEAARVLRPGGRVCIVPLDVGDRYVIRTDPTLRRPGFTIDEGAALIEYPGLGQRHERFYDVPALQHRVLSVSRLLTPSFALVENVADVCGAGRPMFLLTLERAAS